MFYQDFAKSITNLINLITKNTLKGNKFRTSVRYLNEKEKHTFFILNYQRICELKEIENILHKNL